MYIDSSTNTCVQCTNPDCKTCKELFPNKCLSCSVPLHLLGEECKPDCGKNFYLDT